MKDYNYSESDIQKYILDELSAEEVLKFETAMKENPEFALEVNNHRKIAKGIEYYGGQKFKTRIKDIYAEVRPEIISNTKSTKSNTSIFKIGLVVLTAVLVLFFVYRYMFSSTEVQPQEIYAQYYKTYDWSPSLRSDEATIQLDKAADFYNSASYSDAIPIIEQFLKENPNNIQARLAIANAHIEGDNPKLAIPHLQHILTLDDVLYQDEANWYLGLTYLKLNQVNDAKAIFDKLIDDPNSDYNDEAKVIRQKLR